MKKVAEQARLQVATILTTKHMEIPKEFQKLKAEVVQRKESEDFVEDDLTRLKQKLRQLDENVKELAYPSAIVLNTKETEQLKWTRLIYVEDDFTPAVIEEQSPDMNACLFRILSLTNFISSLSPFSQKRMQMINRIVVEHIHLQ